MNRIALSLLLLGAFVSASLISCSGGPRVRVVTNIPVGTTAIVVDNAIPATVAEIYVNGKLVARLRATDAPFHARVWNPTDYSSGINVLARVNEGDRFLGSASRTFYVSSYGGYPQSWTITSYDLRGGNR